MPCRIGITTNIATRRSYWNGRVQGMRNFGKISSHSSRSAAQAAENRKAASHGCNSSPGGGGDPNARWHVYHFYYTRDMGP